MNLDPTVTTHALVQELLPWYVNGSLNGAELVRVRTHLGTCLTCRRELDREQRLRAAYREQRLVYEPVQVSLDRVLARIDAAPASAPGAPAPRRPARTRRWFDLAAAAAVAALAFFVPGEWQLPGSGGAGRVADAYARFETLAGPPARAAQAGDLTVVFHPGVDAHARAAVIERLPVRVVAGPNAAGAVTLRLAGDAAGSTAASERVLAWLRARDDVLLAEPAVPATVSRR